MGVLGNSQRLDERLQGVPTIGGQPDPGTFEGAISGTLGGLAAVPVDIANTVDAATSSFGSGEVDPSTGRWLTHGQVQARDAAAQADGFKVRPQLPAAEQALQDWAQLDTRNTGAVGRAGHGIVEGLGVGAVGSVAGPWGAAGLMGATFGHKAFAEAKASGANDETAYGMAVLNGTVSAAGAFIPMKFGKSLLSSMGLGAGVNVGLGAAQRYGSAKILEAGGYPVMASQYRTWDGEAIASDVVLGAAFGAWGHITHPEVREAISPAQVDAASAVNAEQVFNRSAPGVITDPEVANLHVETLQKAVNDIERGRVPEVDPEVAQHIVDGVLPDEANPPDASAVDAAAHDEYGIVYDAAMADIPEEDIAGLTFGGESLTQNNASGESIASQEAVSRIKLEKDNGQVTVRIGRDGTLTPVIGPDAANAVAKPGELVVQHGVGGKDWMKITQANDVSNSQAEVRIRQAKAELEALRQHEMAARTQDTLDTSPPPGVRLDTGPTGVSLDPYHAEQLDHLVAHYGDLPYVDEQGNTTTIKEAAQAMKTERDQIEQDSRLHDIAAACAARNGS